MKRLIIVITVLGVITLKNQVSARNLLKHGFDLNGTIGTSQYYEGIIGGIEFGNRWYVFKTEQLGIAVMADWLDIAMGFNQNSPYTDYNDYRRHLYDLSLIEFGPPCYLRF